MKPLVSIGVPLYNVEKYAHKIKKLWEQSYSNIEILISDNASTDQTVSLVTRALRGKKNFILYRSKVNRGAPWNFNRTFRMARGKYFMWASLDDSRSSNFIEKAVELLEQEPQAVLGVPTVHVAIEGNPGCLYTVNVGDAGKAQTLEERYRYALNRFPAVGLYGVYRSAALRQTGLMASIPGGDLPFVDELVLQGKILHVPGTKFYYFGRTKWNTNEQDKKMSLGISIKKLSRRPGTLVAKEKIKRLFQANLPPKKKATLSIFLAQCLLKKILIRLCINLLNRLPKKNLQPFLLKKIYWNYIYDPKICIKKKTLFQKRIVLPTIGSK